MEKLVSDIARKTMYSGCAAILLMTAMGFTGYITGVLFGMALGLLSMLVLSRDASLIVTGQSRAVKRIVRNYFIRYVLLAVALIAYCGFAGGSILSCFIGLAMVQISVMWSGVSKATFESK